MIDALFAEMPPVPGVTLMTREVPDYARYQRGLVENIITKFPGRPDGNADEQFAHRISKAAQGADLVWDFHGTSFGESSYAFCGEHPTNPLVFGVAGMLSDQIVHCPPPHAASLLPNYIGWDISKADVGYLVHLFGWLTMLTEGWIPPLRALQHYRHTTMAVTAIDAEHLGLAKQYTAFERLPDRIAQLGVPLPAYALAWDAEQYGDANLYGEIVVPYEG